MSIDYKKVFSLTHILLFIAIFIGALFVFNIFKRGKSIDTTTYKKIISLQDSLIKSKQDIIDTKNEQNTQLNQQIASHEKQDSILLKTFLDNQKNYKLIDARIKNIPIEIARIRNNDDSIRAAFSRD